jgi:hypothetical protein
VIAASADLLAELPLSAACAVLALGRSSYYRRAAQEASEQTLAGRPYVDDPVLWAALDEVVLTYPRCGYEYPTQSLRRAGFRVNPKRVYRLMHAAGWLQPCAPHGAHDGQRPRLAHLSLPAFGLRLAGADGPEPSLGRRPDLHSAGR